MATPPKRHFLGWDRPVLHSAADWLAGVPGSGLLDLADWLVIVPTRHAGRRLREHFAQRSGHHAGGVVPPVVGTPQSLIAMAIQGLPVADRQLQLAVWVEVLRTLPVGACPRLFPGLRERRDLPWAVASAQRFLQVQHLLGEKGLTIRGLAGIDEAASHLEEPERWEELAKIEAAVADVLASMGLLEPTPTRAEAVGRLVPPPGVTQVAVLGVPDPIPIALLALETLQKQVPVHVVIHAPATIAHAFDEWGRPLNDFWSKHPLPLEEASIELVGSPDDMGRTILETVERVGIATADLVVGVPDASVVPYLTKTLGTVGLSTHDPAGLPLRNHPLVALLEHFAELRETGRFATLATLFRHPDYLRLLQREAGNLAVKTLLAELDAFQNEYLPTRLADVTRHLARNARATGTTLGAAMKALSEHLESLSDGTLGQALLKFLARVYSSRQLHLERPEDRAFQAAARAISDLLYRLDLPVFDQLSLTPNERFLLLRQSLSGVSYYLDRDPEAVDLLGWLELHWDDAPWVVVTGMNDGRVPEAVVGDAFLPDALRQAVGIACNTSRFGRDAYLAQAMVASRQLGEGASSGVRFVVGKVSASGDPLRPSRLLFLCDDEKLAPRVARLFHELPPARSAPVSPRRWLLQPPPGPLPRHLSVTALRDYLACPFRFYLKRVLSMGQVDDRARELDPMQFGILCHEALEALGRCEELADNCNEDDLAAFLEASVTRRVAQWFGRQVPVAVQMQVDSARQRLRWAARVEAAERVRGWRIVSVESNLGTRATDTLGRFPLRGRIDRLDKHADGYRVLDYKTRERTKSPAASHLRNARPDTPDWQRVELDGKEYEWTDLQLPLYAHFVGQSLGKRVRAGIFDLPGAVSQTAVTLFDELTPDLEGSALACAEAAANAIAAWKFWPPRKVEYDDFEGLLGPDPTAAVDVEAFLAMLDGLRQEGA